MKDKLIIGLMFCLVLTLFIGQASAWTSSEFTRDEIKSLDKLTNFGTYTIKESAWYDPLKIWTDGFPNPWVNTGFSHMITNGYEASFFKLYRNSEA